MSLESNRIMLVYRCFMPMTFYIRFKVIFSWRLNLEKEKFHIFIQEPAHSWLKMLCQIRFHISDHSHGTVTFITKSVCFLKIFYSITLHTIKALRFTVTHPPTFFIQLCNHCLFWHLRRKGFALITFLYYLLYLWFCFAKCHRIKSPIALSLGVHLSVVIQLSP